MRLISINRLYLLKIFPTLIAIAMIAFFALFLPAKSQAAPQVVNAFEENRGDWRNYYRDKFFADMHSHDLMDSLNAFVTEDPLIKEAIRLRIKGEWKESIDTLTGLIADQEVLNQDEVAYALGLIYESVALFPEAMGNYERVDFESGEPKGDLYYKTLLRKSYVKFISGLKVSTLPSMNDADGGFHRVFEQSLNETDWMDALSAHAVVLFFLGAHEDALLIFQNVLEYRTLKPADLFVQAENYMNMGLYQDAQAAFKELLSVLENSSRREPLSYIYLRLGDIASIRGETDEALNHYKLITPELLEGEEIIINELYIIQSMAMAEIFIESEKNNEAIELFNRLLSGPMPIGFDLREVISLNMVLLYATEELELQAFNRAMEFMLLYPGNPYEDEVMKIIEVESYKRIAALNGKKEYNNLLQYYYENMRFINQKDSLIIVGNVLLGKGFSLEANKIFTALWKRGYDYKDIDLLAGLAMSEAMLGELSEARVLLALSLPANSSDRLKVVDRWRLIGDLYYRKGDIKNALSAYDEVRKVIYDGSVELRYGAILTKLNRNSEAIALYKSLLKRAPSSEIRGLAYQGAAGSYAAIGNLDRALKNYELALKLAGMEQVGVIHYKIGEINYAMGNDSQATSAWGLAVIEDVDGYYGKLSALRIEEIGIWKRARL